MTATYDTGGTLTDEDVTAQAAYTSSKTDVAVMGTDANRHIATAVSGGTSTITASFGGKTATAQFNTRYPVALKVSCSGYQSGTETAPVWKIDWADVPVDKSGDKTVPYTVTVVYDDGTEKENVQSLCSATQTYTAGTAGEGNCFKFDKGTITQADGGHQDTGGNGTVTFSYTEAGKTAELDVKWWKLYFVKLELNIHDIMCRHTQTADGSGVKNLVLDESSPTNLALRDVTGTYNDNSTKTVGKYNDSELFGSNALTFTNKGTRPSGVSDSNWEDYYLKHESETMKVVPQRKGTVAVKSPKTYRGLYLEQDINVWAAGAISTLSDSFVFPQKFAPDDIYYAAYVDADGGHVCRDDSGVYDIGFYRGGGLYYASDYEPAGNGYQISANTIVNNFPDVIHSGGSITFYCWNEYTYREINESGEYAGKFAEYPPKAGTELSPRPIHLSIDSKDW